MSEPVVLMILQRRNDLAERLPILCICGAVMPPVRDISSARYAGVETDACEACGAPQARLIVDRGGRKQPLCIQKVP